MRSLVLAAVFGAVTMQAAVLVSEQGPINFFTASSELASNNIQFNDFGNQQGLSLLAKTNNGLTTLKLSSDEAIRPQGLGQASVESADGSFLTLNIAPLFSTNFMSALFFNVNLDQTGNHTYPDALTVTVDYVNLTGTPTGVGTQKFTLHTNGLDGFLITVDNGFGMTNVGLQSTQAMKALEQIRVLGGTFPPNDQSGVPEPATMSMLGLGLSGLVYWRRR